MGVTEIRFQLVPATVSITNGEDVTNLPKTSVYVTNKGLHIYKDSDDGPVEAFQSTLLSFEGTNKTGWVATTDDGDTIEFNRSSGCLCGSRLRGFRPFGSVPYTNTNVYV